MSSEPAENHPIDDLVRSYLEQQASAEDTTALTARVLASMRCEESIDSCGEAQPVVAASRLSQRMRRLLKPVGMALAAVAALWIGFFFGRQDSTAYAGAATLVRAALRTHGEPIERCYVVSVERDQGEEADFKPPRDVRIWTQGDRFWVDVERGDRRWAWGCKTDGTVWTTLGPRRAVEIAPDEAGRPLQYMTGLYSLELASLLQTILREYELEHTASTDTTHVVTARPAGQRPRWIRAAVIEVDRETKAVRRLVLHRYLPERGTSTLTCTLVDSRSPEEARYQPEGHLTEPFRILTSDESAERRREALVARFGPGAEKWIQAESASRTR